MTTISENFTRMMNCKSLPQLGQVLSGLLTVPVVSSMSESELNETYKAKLAGNEYFSAYCLACMLLVNSLRNEDYPGIYSSVGAMLYTSLLEDAKTAFAALSLAWPVMAFCQMGPKPANIMTMTLIGTWIMNATKRKREEGRGANDGEVAMLVFQSMTIFHILALKKIPSLPRPPGDPVVYAAQMEKLGFKGASAWVKANS